MALGFIYKVTNIIDNKIYVGSTKRPHERKLEHFRFSNKKNLLSRAIFKHGRDNFVFEILEEVAIETMIFKENFYINKLNSLYPNGYNLCNNKYVIENNIKQKRSLTKHNWLKGVAANIGKKRSEYTKKLQSKAKLGKPFLKKRKPIKAEINETILSFNSINEASQYFNIDRRIISNNLNGWSEKTSKGIKFTYGEKI